MLDRLIEQLAASRHLSQEEAALAVELLADEAVAVTSKADFLAHLARKGETAEEIAAFACSLRAKSIQTALDCPVGAGEILDVVGTGGDHLNTFNISTAAALVAAAAGARVAKHGNRASTSTSGSADVLEALGIPHAQGPEEAARSFAEHGFAFFFAPKYHPAFRHIIPARKLCAQRGQATIFNYLGPLLNPARPTAILVGVPRPDLCEPFARVLQSLGLRRAMVVCGDVPEEAGALRHIDELSTLGPTTVAEFYHQRGLACSSLPPTLFPLQAATLHDLRGGDAQTNAAIIRRVLAGEERGPKRDVVLLNAAAALFVGNRTASLLAGWDLAANAIDSGQAVRKLQELTGRAA